MDTIYITGHRNPDTDSIVSAMAYAALKNALGQRQYEAARLGQISDETQTVLDRFGFQPPKLLNNVRTQVRDANKAIQSNTTVMKKRSTSYKPSERAVHWLKGGQGRV